jgi:hypothetical protein
MKTCKACKEKIDEKAKICPHCHTKQPMVVGTPAAIIAMVISVIIVLGILGAIFGGSGNSTNNSNNNTSTPAPTKTPVTQQMKNDYVSFYKQYMAIANKSDATNNKVLDDLTAAGVGTNSMSTADLYLEASDAHDTQDGLKTDSALLQIPDSLGSYSSDLQTANNDLFRLVSSRSDAMKNTADFLNSNDLSKLKSIKDSAQEQQSAMEQAVVSLVTVGTKLGVDTTKIQVGQ